MFPVIQIFSIDIGAYGLLILVGVVVAYLISVILRRLANKDIIFKDFGFLFLFTLAFGVIGAGIFRPITKIPSLLLHLNEFNSLKQAINFLGGEIVFYGGFISGLVGIYLYCKLYKLEFLKNLDLASICVALAHSFGRLGCLFGGCCYGKEISQGDLLYPLTIVYPHNKFFDEHPEYAERAAPRDVHLLAVPLIESIFMLILTVVLCVVFLKLYRENKQQKYGFVAGVYALSYGCWRFGIEFLRGDEIRGGFMFLTTSQWISLAVIIAGVFLIFPKFLRKIIRK